MGKYDSNIKKLKKKLGSQIRAWFLANTETNGRGEYFCPLKKRYYPADQMQVCHYIDRSTMSTRYEKDNLCLCSKASNYWDAQKMVEGYKSQHHKDFEEYLGEEKVQKLLEKSKELVIFTEQEIEDYLEQYKTE